MEQRAIGVDRGRAVARQQLKRQERRASRGGALVLESAAEELQLLAVAELADRAVGDGALAEVLAARGALELVLPLRPERRELGFGAGRRQLVGFRRRLSELRQRKASAAPARRTSPTA